ncbi:MAG TPA: hypothetical protein VMY76_07215 [Gemmatimonadales bacterium]|nr:hypothetical protein [Gemmatimonadales bacterium]
MKVRQVASALSSVYAVGLADELKLIDRRLDGRWGPWKAAEVSAREIVNLGTVVAGLGTDGRVVALQRQPSHGWHSFDLKARELCATYIPSRGPALFAGDGERAWCTSKDSPSTPWRDWTDLGGPIAGLDAAVIPGGGLALFGLRDGVVYHRWQDRPFSEWHEWTALDAPPTGVTAVRAERVKNGGLAVFAIGGDGALYHRWQNQAFTPWHAWESLGGALKSLAVTSAHNGGLAVFGIGVDDGVMARYQDRPFGEWSDWLNLGAKARGIAVQASYIDGLEVFAVGLDDELRHSWCQRLGGDWTSWAMLDYEAAALPELAGVPQAG